MTAVRKPAAEPRLRLTGPLLAVLCLGSACQESNPAYIAPLALGPPCPLPRVERSGECAARRWDLGAWLARHAGQRLDIVTSQSGDAEPAHFVSADLRAEAASFRAAWEALIGPVPRSVVPLDACEGALAISPQQARALADEPYRVHRVAYRGAHGDYIPALLLAPHRPAGRLPAVIVAHQAEPSCGKAEPAGLCGNPVLALARTLARAGLVALAPDAVGFGERALCHLITGQEYSDAAPLLQDFPEATLTGLHISDLSRAIDYLQALPFVDPMRVGIVGHSHGGVDALFAAAFEPRLRCAVSNAGPNLIRREVRSETGLRPGIDRWAGFGFLPGLAHYNNNPPELPVEMHQLYALVAPRGLFLSMMEDDSIAPAYDRIDFAVGEARMAFDVLGGSFDDYTVRSGLTPECRQEIGVSYCIADLYQRCAEKKDPGCIERHEQLGLTHQCIIQHRLVSECAWHLYWYQCHEKEGRDVQECRERFAPLGITEECIDAGMRRGCLRDHGWYPETEQRAFPWLQRCLEG